MAIDLELATIEDIIAEMNKRHNCPFVFIMPHPDGTHEIQCNHKAFPTVFHLMGCFNICQQQFTEYLYHKINNHED